MTSHPRNTTACMALLAILLLPLAACNVDDEESCAQLASILEAKRNSVPRDCVRDDECILTPIGPQSFLAVRRFPDDAEFKAAEAAFAARCAPAIDPRRLSTALLETRCVINPDASQRCEILFEGQIVDGQEVTTLLEETCTCSTNEECGEGQFCANACRCLPPCEAACETVSQCDGWEQLGLGTTVASCVDVCEDNFADPEVQTLASCVALITSCQDVASCF